MKTRLYKSHASDVLYWNCLHDQGTLKAEYLKAKDVSLAKQVKSFIIKMDTHKTIAIPSYANFDRGSFLIIYRFINGLFKKGLLNIK